MVTPLRRWREARGLTLIEVAEAVGCDPGTLSSIETMGKLKRRKTSAASNPSLRRRQRRTYALRFPVDPTSGASPELANALALFSKGALTEEQIIWPTRWVEASLRTGSQIPSPVQKKDLCKT